AVVEHVDEAARAAAGVDDQRAAGVEELAQGREVFGGRQIRGRAGEVCGADADGAKSEDADADGADAPGLFAPLGEGDSGAGAPPGDVALGFVFGDGS